MTHQEWLQHGIDNQWVTATCLMHRDVEVFTEEERHRFYILGEDPCIPRYVINPPTQ